MRNVSDGPAGAAVPATGISTVTGSKAQVLGGTGTMCAETLAVASRTSSIARIVGRA